MHMADILIYVLLPLLLVSLFIWFLRVCERAHEVDWGNIWLNRLDGLNRIFCRRYHRLRADAIPLPEHGSALLVSNHVSGLDPFLLIAACKRPLRFLIAREEYERFGLQWLFHAAGCIPVDRSGRPETAFREALRALDAGEVIALFPHGGIHITRQTDERPARIKGGVIKMAQRSGTHIYPVMINGIRVKGLVVLPIFIPSRATIKSLSPMVCVGQEYDKCLEELAHILHDVVD